MCIHGNSFPCVWVLIDLTSLEKQFILFCKAEPVNKLYLNDCLLAFPSGQVPIFPITNRTPLKL